ncbi:uncharacterized protein PSANT_03449 [Moesziomyces antarcticus]|uniref:Secreted protein n=1 Tax=Pseudozyma antarctica TaxID=84753 RepID=A0A5C3FMW5_PSEA2|nr:uncharacterized protein PSANT_03449 [Moesziomyces antarcticus]
MPSDSLRTLFVVFRLGAALTTYTTPTVEHEIPADHDSLQYLTDGRASRREGTACAEKIKAASISYSTVLFFYRQSQFDQPYPGRRHRLRPKGGGTRMHV